MNDDRPACVDPQTEWVACWVCGEVVAPENAASIDISPDDEYYPNMRPVCPRHAGGRDE